MSILDNYTVGRTSTGTVHLVKINHRNLFMTKTFCNANLNSGGRVTSISEMPEATTADVTCQRCANKAHTLTKKGAVA
jgi:hypothetical protein